MKTGFKLLILIMLCGFFAQAQSQLVKGHIVDESGEPLIGVSVQVKGTYRGSTSDLDGNYVIGELNSNDVLEYSYIGYEKVSHKVGTQRVIDVVMRVDSELLEEVQVVAFQKQKKESVIGSINTVKVAELKQPTSNLTHTLAGRVAGVISYQRSGEPGADNSEFFIRGITSFGYKSNPLILLDGVEISSRDLARIEPDNVESFSIMKDATATALYGARGANGVILVTTKGGDKGKMHLAARFETSVAVPTMLNEFVDGVDYMEMYNEARRMRNVNSTPRYTKDKIEATRSGLNEYAFPNTDWYGELFKTSTINTRANVNANGGGEVARYYFSVSYNNDQGMLNVDPQNNFNNNIDIDRYNLRANVDVNITKTTKASVKFYSVFEQYNGPATSASDIFSSVMQANPVDFPKYYPKNPETEQYNFITFGNIGNANSQVNPYARMVSGYKDSFTSNIFSQFKIEQDLSFVTEGLKLRGLASVKNYSEYGSSRSYQPFYYGLDTYDPRDNTYTISQLREGTEYLQDPQTYTLANSTTYFELASIYNREFGQHDLGGLLVATAQERLNTTPGNNVFTTLPARNMGLSGRFTYGFDSRYHVEFNFGYNGSERFAQGFRYGFFPSAGTAWTISNEDFWTDFKDVVNVFKLRATYGLVGNDAIASDYDRFLYLSNVNLSDYGKGYKWDKDFDNFYPGYSVNRYPNPQVTWEVATKTNIGLELGLYDKLTLQMDVFQEKRDQIYWPNEYVPSMIGWGAQVSSNLGSAASRGIDLSLDYQQYFDSGLWMTGRLNFTYATNEITQNGEPNYPYAYMSRLGQPITQRWGLVADRLFIDQADIDNSPVQTYQSNYKPGDIKYVDVNDDGRIDDNDKVPIGYPESPEAMYGFGLSMGYKGFDFSFFFQGSAMSSFFVNPADIAPFVNERNALKVVADNYWSETNQDPYAFWPRLSTEPVANNNQISTWWLQNGSFLRAKSVEFGYSLPSRINKKVGLDELRFYFSGTNLFTISEFKLWDPEMGGNGLGYPPQAVFNFGVNLSL